MYVANASTQTYRNMRVKRVYACIFKITYMCVTVCVNALGRHFQNSHQENESEGNPLGKPCLLRFLRPVTAQLISTHATEGLHGLRHGAAGTRAFGNLAPRLPYQTILQEPVNGHIRVETGDVAHVGYQRDLDRRS